MLKNLIITAGHAFLNKQGYKTKSPFFACIGGDITLEYRQD
jgi:hypothetical protein